MLVEVLGLLEFSVKCMLVLGGEMLLLCVDEICCVFKFEFVELVGWLVN